ncbi:mucosal pentraxin-like [Alosa alosa]|uniref:mucosal pentraxin-like n=1 Tax=Alosa alosa TaxID=278164 RepID=UPI0020150D80|nr:mucosal pentraxin-like [Alosa alosa]
MGGQLHTGLPPVGYYTDLPQSGKEQSFFSLATRSHNNGFLLSKEGLNRHQMYIGSTMADFWGLPDELNAWNSFCATWESETGLTQVWLNGKPSSRKTLFKDGSLTGRPFIVLGQDQDRYGAGMHENDALVGQLTDVHMWDREIENFSKNRDFEKGSMIKLHDLVFTTNGNVVLEDKITSDSGPDNCSTYVPKESALESGTCTFINMLCCSLLCQRVPYLPRYIYPLIICLVHKI